MPALASVDTKTITIAVMTGGHHVADIAAALGLDPVVHRRGEVEARVGLSHDEMVRWWRAMGFAEVPEDEVAFGDDDIKMATSLATLLASGTVQERDILRLARVLGASFSRIAEAQVALLDDSLHDQLDGLPIELVEPEGPELGIGELLEMLEEAIVYVWRRHLLAAFGRRLRLEDAIMSEGSQTEISHAGEGRDDDREGEGTGDDRDGDGSGAAGDRSIDHGVRASTIGFVDIVGFSKLSKQLGADELADLVDAFEASALEVSAVHDARVVKFIGDAAMFVADDLATGVRIGLELQAQARAGDNPVELHCGVAHGPAVTMGGDVFGSTVNLASRLTDVARRDTVAVPRSCAPELAEHDDLVVRNVRRTYDLKGIGRTRISVVSLAPPTEPDDDQTDLEASVDISRTSDQDSETAGSEREVEVVVEFPAEDPDDPTHDETDPPQDPTDAPEGRTGGEGRRSRRDRGRRDRHRIDRSQTDGE